MVHYLARAMLSSASMPFIAAPHLPGPNCRLCFLPQEKPTSDMAVTWIIEHGVLLSEEHAKYVPAYLLAKSRKKGVG